MKIHEYQAKELFKKYKIPIPDGGIALTPDEAKKNAAKIGNFPVVIKGQIHAGGRGKGGGIKLAETVEEVESLTKRILGMLLITHQTGPEGKIVKKVLVEKSLKIEKELYLSIILDRATAKIVIIASKAGGMDIEEIAANQPEKIIKIHIDPLLGIQPFHCRQAAFGLKLPPSLIRQFTLTLINLYRLFVDYDCTLVEINPLAITADENIVALDAKIIFDDNALFRHKDILEYRDL
ncbi:MAG: acetate--CoA ligase family protein, partial [Desulfobacterales bacterium]|nr:acetate--CoA ligase family protein [Desulfobacterales bacterium]